MPHKKRSPKKKRNKMIKRRRVPQTEEEALYQQKLESQFNNVDKNNQ